MCGIAGIAGNHLITDSDTNQLHSMCDAIIHRGPDSDGYYANSNIAIGMRRLAIIDLKTGEQPIHNEDKSIWIVFNGEIYDYSSLRARLVDAGHIFYTQTDTEVIVHAYEEFGENFVEHLRGMFAIALWDDKNQKLILARDRLGKKPLLYSLIGDKLYFASEFTSLLQVPEIKKQTKVNERAIPTYLTYGYIPAPFSAFENISKLPPAHILTFQNGEVKTRRYWELNYLPKLDISEDEACERILHELSEAVKIRLVSDVPIGAFLSGGVDSSAVVALMSQLMDSPVKTFSIGFKDQNYSELEYAKEVAQLYRTDHHEFIVEPHMLDILPELVRHYGEPYADSSAIPTYYVAQQTRQHVTVALNGDGGDENFAGYTRYLLALKLLKLEAIPDEVRKISAKVLTSIIPNTNISALRKIKGIAEGLDIQGLDVYKLYISLMKEHWQRRLLGPELAEYVTQDILNIEDKITDYRRYASLDKMIARDVNSYLPEDLLVKVDIASMANSLEARSPLLDHKFMEFSATLPVSFKLKENEGKYIFKKALRKLLPDSILYRKKMGFGIPVGRWLQNEARELMMDTLLSTSSLNRRYYNKQVLEHLIKDHIDGTGDHTTKLWPLLMFELWHQQFIGNTIDTPEGRLELSRIAPTI